MSFEPKWLGFLCQNSADLCADFAGVEQKSYTPNFLPVRLPCLAGLDTFFLLKAYFSGADGVFVLGCPPGRCRHKRGNDVAKRRVQVVQSLLETLGIEKDRLDFAWIHPSEISKLVEIVDLFNERLIKLGPLVLLQSEDQEKFNGWTQFKKCDACHQCREICPICFCKKCYPESFSNFGIGWLVHVMERCTGCGLCKDVCPQGIHLSEIVQLLHRKISNLSTLPLNFPLSHGSEKVRVVNITK